MKKNYTFTHVGKYILLCLFCSVLISVKLSGQLNGSYTIGASGTEDYATISAAVTALTTQGINGPVVFNISEGEYNEQISIPEITGASETNTIVFQSVSGDTTDVKIYYDPATTDVNYTICLDGSKYLRLKNLSLFSNGASAFGNVVVFKNNVKDVEFDGNHFYGKTGDCTFKDKHLIRDDEYSYDTSIVFKNNTFEHARGAFYMEYVTNLTISKNSFINGEVNYFGLALSFIEYGLIENNFISASVNLFGPYGNSSNIIRNNTITNILDLYSLNSTEGKEALVYNNFIKYKLVIRSCNYTKVYNNTISSTANPLTVDNLCTQITLLNNIFKSSNASYAAMNIGELADIEIEDYNDLYSPGTKLVTANSTDYATLTDWQTASSMSVHSYNQNLTFVDDANYDLHIASGNPDLYGKPITEIKYDIDGVLRNKINPNVGADEYTKTPMSGEYTIGKSGTEDFSSFSEAVEALAFNGISGYTNFTVSSGIYEEQFTIPEIAGTSASSMVYFAPATGLPDDVVISFSLKDDLNPSIVNLDGADFIYFHYISFIVAPDSYSGIAINFQNGAGYNRIWNCNFTGLQTVSEGGSYSILYSPDYAASIDEYNSIAGNTFTYGSYGIYLTGIDANNQEKGNAISGNKFSNQYKSAILLYYQDSCTVSRDSITINSSVSWPYGIYIYGSENEMVFNNHINIESASATAGGSGIHIYNGTGDNDHRASVFNNFITVATNAEVNTFGIVLQESPYRNIYSNTVNITGSNSISQAFRIWGTTSEWFNSKNNIFANNAGGNAFRSDVVENFNSDYNNYYTTGTELINNYSTLALWQAAKTKDEHSLSVNPRFISNDDLHIYHAFGDFNGAGTPLNTGNTAVDAYLHRDIDTELRNASNPDIGADEYLYISEENDFLTYSLQEQTGDAIINTVDDTILAEVGYNTDLSSLIATFTISENATVAIGSDVQVSGVTTNNFTSPVLYTITAQDGSEQVWIVTVSKAPNNASEIIAYSFTEQTGPAVINSDIHTIQVEVQYGTDLTALIASFSLSAGASAKIGTTVQVSNVTANNFSQNLIYTITAENGVVEQNWTVSVTVDLNNENDILSFSVEEQTSAAVINKSEHTVYIQVAKGTDVSNLIANFTLSGDARAIVNGINQVSGITGNDYSNNLVYIIEAQDGTQQIWTVTVEVNTTGIEETAITGITLFPNPVTEFINISSSLINNSLVIIELIDINGCVVFQREIFVQEELNVTLYFNKVMSAGIYYSKIKTPDRTWLQKFIVK
ncbi:MAG: right-handed parallel beta-helix repeat-containing protein [Bacteroidales bacterium]|nr:right-handed parallel beta-helix repeat-containing protein [Bacteroidales bacterium]